MPKRPLSPLEMEFFQQIFNESYRISDIRLREGEYQYELAKGIAAFQLELQYPNVKDLVERLYGEEKANDVQFIRKIQTILKKMEKRKVVKILPKNKPWELQRYGLSSFSFEDADKNRVVLASEQQIKQAKNQLLVLMNQQGWVKGNRLIYKARIYIMIILVAIAYTSSVWTFSQPTINPVIFIPAFIVAVVCSLILGRLLSKE